MLEGLLLEYRIIHYSTKVKIKNGNDKSYSLYILTSANGTDIF